MVPMNKHTRHTEENAIGGEVHLQGLEPVTWDPNPPQQWLRGGYTNQRDTPAAPVQWLPRGGTKHFRYKLKVNVRYTQNPDTCHKHEMPHCQRVTETNTNAFLLVCFLNPISSKMYLAFKTQLEVRQAGTWDPLLQGLHLDTPLLEQ